MPLFRSRRRLVNRRRRSGWLTPRGRAVLFGGTAALLTMLVIGPPLWASWQRSETNSAVPISLAREVVPSEEIDAPTSWVESESVLESESVERVERVESAKSVEHVERVEKAEASEVDPMPAEVLAAVSAAPPETMAGLLERPYFDPPRSRERFEASRDQPGMIDPNITRAPLAEWREPGEGDIGVAMPGRVRVEYSMDEELTENVFGIMRKGRASKGHAIVLDPRTGKLLAYVSTDEKVLPADKAYPAASIVKILTASAVLETEGTDESTTCTYSGNKYRLSRRRLDEPKRGHEASLETALASSNNQCFARWALHSVGEPRLLETFERFGWLSRPAPGHEAGRLEEIEDDLDVGRLGSGLDGAHVTPLHVAQMASILTHGEWVEPWWIDRVVDAFGRPLDVADRRPNRRVLEPHVATRLRSMMVATTKRGTAKSAFRDRRGRPRVGSIDIAGKTGNLTGWDPHGRYEWFMGLAPAEDPTIAVVVLQLQGHVWWRRSAELASDILRDVFCDRAGCRTELADRLIGGDGDWPAPTLISDQGRPRVIAKSD